MRHCSKPSLMMASLLSHWKGEKIVLHQSEWDMFSNFIAEEDMENYFILSQPLPLYETPPLIYLPAAPSVNPRRPFRNRLRGIQWKGEEIRCAVNIQ